MQNTEDEYDAGGPTQGFENCYVNIGWIVQCGWSIPISRGEMVPDNALCNQIAPLSRFVSRFINCTHF